jgi:hypothetical protein
MTLIGLVVTLILVGLLLYVIEVLLPIDATIKKLIRIVVIVVVLLWLLQALGVLGGLGTVRLR